MAKCGGKKYEAGGKVKKAIKDTKKFVGDKETDLPPPDNFKRSKPKKPVPKDNPGLKKLPTEVRNKMGYMKKGGKVGYKKGGAVKCKRDGVCVRGKTKGRMV